jgi:hypothetical protein
MVELRSPSELARDKSFLEVFLGWLLRPETSTERRLKRRAERPTVLRGLVFEGACIILGAL